MARRALFLAPPSFCKYASESTFEWNYSMHVPSLLPIYENRAVCVVHYVVRCGTIDDTVQSTAFAVCSHDNAAGTLPCRHIYNDTSGAGTILWQLPHRHLKPRVLVDACLVHKRVSAPPVRWLTMHCCPFTAICEGRTHPERCTQKFMKKGFAPALQEPPTEPQGYALGLSQHVMRYQSLFPPPCPPKCFAVRILSAEGWALSPKSWARTQLLALLEVLPHCKSHPPPSVQRCRWISGRWRALCSAVVPLVAPRCHRHRSNWSRSIADVNSLSTEETRRLPLIVFGRCMPCILGFAIWFDLQFSALQSLQGMVLLAKWFLLWKHSVHRWYLCS